MPPIRRRHGLLCPLPTLSRTAYGRPPPLSGVWPRRLSQTTSPSHPVLHAAALVHTCCTHWFPTPRACRPVRFSSARAASPGLQARFCLCFLPLVARSLARLQRHAPALGTPSTPPLGGSHSLVLPSCRTPASPSRLPSILPMGAACAARLDPPIGRGARPSRRRVCSPRDQPFLQRVAVLLSPFTFSVRACLLLLLCACTAATQLRRCLRTASARRAARPPSARP